MVGKNSQEKTKATSTSNTDHLLPMQGEYSMKTEEENGKKSLMDEVQLEIDMEKRKIREEIIASEIIRRRELEAEVRLELMMEKQMMGIRSYNNNNNNKAFYSCVDPCCMLMNSGFLDFYKNLMNVGSSGDDLGENRKLINQLIGGVQGINPDPHKNNVFGNGENRLICEAFRKCASEGDPVFKSAAQIVGKSVAESGGEEVRSQAVPSSGISGMKRKAETSIAARDEETESIASKDLQKKWHCSLCGISATSAGGFNLHLHGKKHEAKEALCKSSGTASCTSTNSYSAENSMQPVEHAKNRVQLMEEEKSKVQPMKEEKIQVQSMEEEKVQVRPMEEEQCQVQPWEQNKSQVTKKWECSLCQVSATSETNLRSHLQGKKHKAKETKLGVGQEMSDNHTEIAYQKGEDVKKWYCSLCQVSAASEKNLNDHFQGKKHKAKAGLSLEGEEGLRNDQETRNTSIEPTKKEVSELDSFNTLNIVNKRDISNIEGKKPETSHLESLETEELEKKYCHSQEMRKEIVKFWLCKICNKGTYDQEAMANHRKSSEHSNLLQKIGGGLIIVSSVLKEAVEGEKGVEDAAHEILN